MSEHQVLPFRGRAYRATHENEEAAASSLSLRAKPNTRRRKNPSPSLMNQSVIRAFDILRAFYHPEEWVAARDLSRRAAIHESSIQRFLPSLVDVGAIVRGEDGRYRCVVFVMPGNQGRRPAAKRPKAQAEQRAG